MITTLYEDFLHISMIDKKFTEEEGEELKKICIHYHDNF